MTGLSVLVIGIVFFTLAYRLYGRYLHRLFGVDESKPTPAHTKRDGVDYVPTKLPVLFGHHFASIAGAGPIVGPIAAVYMGWAPVVLWILLGAVLVGAMHDFAALFLSVRDEGRSIGHVIERQLGFAGRQIFLLFSWAALILVVAIFAILVAGTFVKTPSVATASLLFVAIAPLFGWLVYRKGLSILKGSLVFVPLMFAFIWIGMLFPLDLVALLGISATTASRIWLAVLLVYVLIASTIPVWLLLQPRDYLNSYLLYSMMIVGFIAIVVARPVYQLEPFMGWSAPKPGGGFGHIFPILYVTVACGACSGFHALVSSGTTAKQLASEKQMLPIGYGAMLVEGLLALMALTSVAVLTREQLFEAFTGGGSLVNVFANGIAGFTTHLGIPKQAGVTFIALSISAFMLTTLDTATRLTRFAWQELFLPRSGEGNVRKSPAAHLFANPLVATVIAVVLAGALALSGSARQIWPVFGASNQLLAAITLLVVTLWLVRRKANFWIALIPMLFMVTISSWALVQLFTRNLQQNWALVTATAFLLAMAVVLAVLAVKSLVTAKRNV